MNQDKPQQNSRSGDQRRGGNDRRGRGRGRGRRDDRERDEFDQSLVDLARVTRVMKGGKRMRFRACIVIGDRKGRVGYGIMKGNDVQAAIGKAVAQAKKNIITIPMVNGTIPHEIEMRSTSAHIFLKPAPKGRGIIAGGAVRSVLELSGIKDVVGKMLGSNKKINNVQATIKALSSLKTKEDYQKLRGKSASDEKTTVEKPAVETADVKE